MLSLSFLGMDVAFTFATSSKLLVDELASSSSSEKKPSPDSSKSPEAISPNSESAAEDEFL